MIVLQIVGYKNAGKTTLAAETIRRLSSLGFLVGAAKHDAHDFEPDVPGTDSWRHREAGAYLTAIASDSRTAWTIERPTALDAMLDTMRHNAVDVAVVEGFKSAPHPKIVLLRDEADNELLQLPNVLAIALRQPNAQAIAAAAAAQLPIFAIGDGQLDELLRYIEALVCTRMRNP